MDDRVMNIFLSTESLYNQYYKSHIRLKISLIKSLTIDT